MKIIIEHKEVGFFDKTFMCNVEMFRDGFHLGSTIFQSEQCKSKEEALKMAVKFLNRMSNEINDAISRTKSV
jgi:hypothetical protein